MELQEKLAKIIKVEPEEIYCILENEDQYIVTLNNLEIIYVIDKEAEYYEIGFAYLPQFNQLLEDAKMLYCADPNNKDADLFDQD